MKPLQREIWIDIERRFIESGLTAKEFCQQNNISLNTFHRRQTKIDRADIEKQVSESIELRKAQAAEQWTDIILNTKEKYNQMFFTALDILEKNLKEAPEMTMRELRVMVQTIQAIYYPHKDLLFSFSGKNERPELPEMPIQAIETFVKAKNPESAADD